MSLSTSTSKSNPFHAPDPRVVVVDANDCVLESTSLRQAKGLRLLHRTASIIVVDETNEHVLVATVAVNNNNNKNEKEADASRTEMWTVPCTVYPQPRDDDVVVVAATASTSTTTTTSSAVDSNNNNKGMPPRPGALEAVLAAATPWMQQQTNNTKITAQLSFWTRLHRHRQQYDAITEEPTRENKQEQVMDYILWTNVPKDSINTATTSLKWVSWKDLEGDEGISSLRLDPVLEHLVQRREWFTQFVVAHNKKQKEETNTSVTFDYRTIYRSSSCQDVSTSSSSAIVVGDTNKKQGAYGKIKIHKESKLKQIMHLDEMVAGIIFLYVKPLESNLDAEFVRQRFDQNDLAFCDEILVEVSRSFAAVIRQLPSTMVVDVLVFYLVLRALDTIEDDMEAFSTDNQNEEKVQHLLSFAENALQNPKWCMDGVGQGDERRLLQEFPKCHRVYQRLKPQSRIIIADITHRMATGMAEFVNKDLGQGTADVTEYNRYCHFVAGLVGEGLSRLFAASGLERPSMASELQLSDKMGEFLQKTNIIRDYLEDYVDKRAFWPQSIWKKYAPTGELGYFCSSADDPVVRNQAIACLNELVTDALENAPDCLRYLAQLECVEIFRFCAIPQVMAIATLNKCYNNPDVFTGVVKIRKGLSCKLILRNTNLARVQETFYMFAKSIQEQAEQQKRCGKEDPNYQRTVKACKAIIDMTQVAAMGQRNLRYLRFFACMTLLVVSILWEYFVEYFLPAAADLYDPNTVQRTLIVVASVVYLYGPFEVKSHLKAANALKATI